MLNLAVTSHLYPRLQAEAFCPGQLTKIRAQAVSGRSCREVAERLGLPEKLRNRAPADQQGGVVEQLVQVERVLAYVVEAVIGACYLHHGFELTAAAVVTDFQPEIENALNSPADYKSALQERLARRRTTVSYEVTAQEGPPHNRVFDVAAVVDGVVVAQGSGRSKKDAEQAAAAAALEGLA